MFLISKSVNLLIEFFPVHFRDKDFLQNMFIFSYMFEPLGCPKKSIEFFENAGNLKVLRRQAKRVLKFLKKILSDFFGR